MPPIHKIKLTPELGPRPVKSQIYAGKKIPLSTFTRLDHNPLTLDPLDTHLLSNISGIISPKLHHRKDGRLKASFMAVTPTPSSIDGTQYIKQINEQILLDENLSKIKPCPVKNPDPNNPLLTNSTEITFVSDFINKITSEDISYFKCQAYRNRIYHIKNKTFTKNHNFNIKTTTKDVIPNKHPIIMRNRVMAYLYHIYHPNRLFFTTLAYKELESIMLLLMEKIMLNLPEVMAEDYRTKRIEYKDIIACEKKLKINHLKGE